MLFRTCANERECVCVFCVSSISKYKYAQRTEKFTLKFHKLEHKNESETHKARANYEFERSFEQHEKQLE